MHLAQWQNSFMAALGPEGCDEEFLSLVNPRESARLEIYRNNTLQALKATLIKAFPICERIVGESCFAKMAQDYLNVNPMQESNLNHYGEGFPRFIEGILDTNSAFIGLEYLAELAQLEWIFLKSYYAADGVSCSELTQIAGLSERQQEDIVMVLRPDIFIRDSGFFNYHYRLFHNFVILLLGSHNIFIPRFYTKSNYDLIRLYLYNRLTIYRNLRTIIK